MAKLHRDIGVIGLTFVAVSGVVGSGWLFAPLSAVQYAGPAAMIAWVVGGGAMLLLALTFAEISAMLPVPGGIARIPQFSHGNVVAMAMGWSGWVGYNTTASIEVEAMLRYLAPYFSWLYTAPGSGVLAWPGMAVAAGLLLLFTVVNALGVGFFAAINSTITWAKITIPILVAVMLVATHFEPGNFVAAGGFAPMGLAGILGGLSSGGIIFSYIGFRHAIDMAGEVKNPGVNVPAALIVAVLLCLLIYGGIQFAFIGALTPPDLAGGWAKISMPNQLGPLSAIASAIGLLWLVSLLNVGAVVGPFGSGLVSVGSNARLALALAENGFFPKLFESLSARGVPLAALVLNFAFAAVALVLLPFTEIVQLNSSAVVLSFVVGPVAVVALRSLLPDAHRPFRLPAVILIAFPAFAIATLILHWSGWSTIWRLGVCLLLGFVLFLFNARSGRREALDTREALWLLPYLAGIGIVSWLGTFGGIGLIGFGWDIVALVALSAVVFALAQRMRLQQDKFDRGMAEERVFETMTVEAP